MPESIKPSAAPGTALLYITLGALMTVWSLAWYLMFTPESTVSKFLCIGLLSTGVVLLAIGFFVGQIGRAARKAELTPPEDTPGAAPAQSVARH